MTHVKVAKACKDAPLPALIGAPEVHFGCCEFGGFSTVTNLTCDEIRDKDGKSGLHVDLPITSLNQEYEHNSPT
jgi:hypothetical protein